MWPSFFSRDKQRASSFTTCLLTVVIVFGGIGFYYFKYFQWRHFEAPKDGLVYAEVKGGQLNHFRKQTVASVIDPTIDEFTKIKDMRKKTKKGTQSYPELEQSCIEVRNKLLAILSEARLRRIPKKFKKDYERTLLAIKDAYDSVNYLEESFVLQGTEREKRYIESIKVWKKGNQKIKRSRDYFNGDGWKL